MSFTVERKALHGHHWSEYGWKKLVRKASRPYRNSSSGKDVCGVVLKFGLALFPPDYLPAVMPLWEGGGGVPLGRVCPLIKIKVHWDWEGGTPICLQCFVLEIHLRRSVVGQRWTPCTAQHCGVAFELLSALLFSSDWFVCSRREGIHWNCWCHLHQVCYFDGNKVDEHFDSLEKFEVRVRTCNTCDHSGLGCGVLPL